ncbi:MAG: hypothetical protein ACHRHE_10480 [Tepidisphaerales bacterium]
MRQALTSIILGFLICAAPALGAAPPGAPLPRLERGSAPSWQAAHSVAPITADVEGFVISATGDDPYAISPPLALPKDQPLWVNIRLKCETAGSFQVFYFRDHATEENSVRFDIPANVWRTERLRLPPLGPGAHLRLDPPGESGTTIVSAIWFEPRLVLTPPQFPAPTVPALEANAPSIQSGVLSIRHAPDQFESFAIALAGKHLAAGHNHLLAGYAEGDDVRWFDLAKSGKTRATADKTALAVDSTFTDVGGGQWHLMQRFTTGAPDTLDVAVELSVDRDREVIHFPLLTLLPGLGSFGKHKTQALLPGLEYLDRDELSSSELDIIGPGAIRRVSDPLKCTMPMMTVVADERYIAMSWRPQENIAAMFDSPDRSLGSEAHVFALLFPGAMPAVREDGQLLPHTPVRLKANVPVRASATIFAGPGRSAVAALQHYIRLNPLPAMPKAPPVETYARTAALGWLDSAAHVENRFRHAWPGQFQPQPAADAAMYMRSLASLLKDDALIARLNAAADGALGEVRAGSHLHSMISHIRTPAQALAFGQAIPAVDAAKQHAAGMLARFAPDGSMPYTAGNVDYGKGHFAPDANGLTAQIVMQALQSASLAGDPQLVDAALAKLAALNKFDDSAPRGAQTWEVPLHTPDILASAHLVDAYRLGYELTGDQRYLDRARYWAWTGIPFVYLHTPPGVEPRGALPYATIAVYGATQWRAPNWMGLPVQWCGLVYAEALHNLAPYDKSLDWTTVALGIGISGANQSFPAGEDVKRQGMLPDSYNLRSGHRNDPGINPGTVQAVMMREYARPPVYSFRCLRDAGKIMLHAPGAIAEVKQSAGEISFHFEPVLPSGGTVLLSNCPPPTKVTLDGKPAADGTTEYDATRRCLTIKMRGQADVLVGLK